MNPKQTAADEDSASDRWSDEELKAAVLSFLDDFSIEATPHAAGEIDKYSEYLPAGTTIYIAHPPNSQIDDVIRMAVGLMEHGFHPVPHLIARKLKDQSQLDRALGQMRDTGVDQILLVAGDVPKPEGPYSCSMDVLESGLLPQHGFQRVGIAGHPEGSRVIGPTLLRKALSDKAQWAADTGLQIYIVTQFGFNAQAFFDWEAVVRKNGVELPVHVGFAGQAPLKQLLRYAMRCGITASMRMLVGKASAMSQQIKLTTVDELALAFAKHRLSHPDCRMVRAHFYAFGGAERTGRWLQAIQSGRFEIAADKLIVEFDS